MRFIHHQHRVMISGDFGDSLKRRNVAVHAEDRFRDDQASSRSVSIFEKLFR